MNKPTNIKFSSHLVLTAVLSGGITIGLSLLYMLLCIAALIFRKNCDVGESKTAATDFWTTIFSVYFLDGNQCTASASGLGSGTITEENTVFILTTITLSFSVLCVVTAITLITIVQDEGATRYLTFAVSAYVGSCFASLVVDLTTAAHFGIDYSFLTSELDNMSSGTGYQIDMLRHGAFLLMSIALKGYMAPLINLIMLILLIIYAAEHRKLLKNAEHSIHKLGVLTAFDQPRKPEENWSTQPEIFSPFARGAQVNNGFINDDETPPRTPRREPTRSDYNYSNLSFDRSDSWHHSQPNLAQSSRPFSYLEDVKRPVPTRPPPSPAVETPWRRDPWPQTPPVPAPDYSPQPARRLKSALKPGYM